MFFPREQGRGRNGPDRFFLTHEDAFLGVNAPQNLFVAAAGLGEIRAQPQPDFGASRAGPAPAAHAEPDFGVTRGTADEGKTNRKEADSVKISPLPKALGFRAWRMA